MPHRAPVFRPPGSRPRKPWQREGKNAHRRKRGRRGVADRRAFLREHPLCEECLAEGLTVAAEEVDHVRDDLPDAEWDSPGNKRALCKPHHRNKTHLEARRG